LTISSTSGTLAFARNKFMERTSSARKRVLRPKQVRDANRVAILQLLRHNEHMSRADLARQTGLSECTVSRMMTHLISDALVCEDGAENSTGGRPGRRLKLNPKRVAIGAEVQNWETRVAVCTMRGHIVESRRFRTRASLEATLELIADEFEDCSRQLGETRVPGIGVSVRGIVNSDAGALVVGSRPGWVDAPISRILQARLREPVYVENNVRAAALAEYNYCSSAVNGSRVFLLVKVDEGIGMAVLLDGKLHYGPRMAAGEFGQMVIAMSATLERHNRPGCLERLASNPALCERYATISRERRSGTSGDTFSRVRRIVQAAAHGDRAAVNSVTETARCLGIGISNVVWGLDVDVVVVDGAICGAWSLVEPAIRDQLDSESLSEIELILRPSAFGGDSALIGAATLPFRILFAPGGSDPLAGIPV
jgi:predicted NBD/HSP70 family sugar kinase